MQAQKSETMAPRSENRGFASMDPGRRGRIASEGGRASHSGRGRGYDDEYEEDYEDDDDDEGQRVSNRRRDEDWNDRYEDEDEDELENDEDDRRGRGYSSRGRRSSGRRGNGSRRGFGNMDPEQRRRIARMGGRATARSHGHEFYEDIGRRGGETFSEEYGPEFYSQIGRRGGRARWEEEDDEDDYGRNRSSRRSSSLSNHRTSRSGRRGFAAMPREEIRRIARMGERARWEEDDR